MLSFRQLIRASVRISDEDVTHQPSTSSFRISPPTELQTCSAFNISPKMIMTPPQEIECLKQRVDDKRRSKTVILTSSPYKAKLEAVEWEKKGKLNKQKRNLIRKPTESNIN